MIFKDSSLKHIYLVIIIFCFGYVSIDTEYLFLFLFVLYTQPPYHWLLAVHVYHINGLEYESMKRDGKCWSLYLDCKQPSFKQTAKAKSKSFDFLSMSKYYNNLSPEKAREAFLHIFCCPLAFKRIAIVVSYTDNMD